MRPVRGFADGMPSMVMEKRATSESTSMRWVLRVMAGVGPDLQSRAVGADAGEAECRRHVDVGGEAARALARRAVEDFQRLGQVLNRNLVRDEIRRAFETGWAVFA